jgi:hypothetical protein
VNIYDPADAILYVHMAQETDPFAGPVQDGRTCARLPVGYANKSARTRIRRPVRCR